MIPLETIEWLSTHISNDKVIDCDNKAVARFGLTVYIMIYIRHAETLFQNTVQYPRTDLPDEAFVRSHAMTGYVCTLEREGEPWVFDQHSARLLIDLETMRERSDRQYNMYRFAGERESICGGTMPCNTGISVDNNKVHDLHQSNNSRRTTVRTSIEASLVTGINTVPRFPSYTPIE